MAGHNQIQIVDNSKYELTLDPKYVVLGMLSEYRGRSICETSNVVERFFVSESKVAEWFKTYLSLLSEQAGILSCIEIEKSETGFSSVLSSEMRSYLNGVFVSDSDSINALEAKSHIWPGPHSKIHVGMFPLVTTPRYLSKERDPRYSYLYGAYLREGSEDELAYRIANASHKVELIKQFLEDLDCEWISHKYYPKGAPTIHHITFGADVRLSKILDRARHEKTPV